MLLKAAEKVYGLVAGFVHCLVDRREPGKVRHTLADLLGQRIFGIACGHPDGNDPAHLADDPIHVPNDRLRHMRIGYVYHANGVPRRLSCRRRTYP